MCTKHKLQALVRDILPSVDPAFVFPYRATFDFEVFFETDNLPQTKQSHSSTAYTAKHVPLSVSVCSNVPHFTEPKCRVVNKGDPQILVNSMVTYLENILDASYSQILYEDFSHVFEQLNKIEETQQQNIDSLNVPAQTFRQKLQEYLRELPVVGLNSSRYDLNVIKPFLIQKFVTQKTASKQMCEETNTEEEKEELDLEQDGFDITEEQEEAEDEEREKTEKTPFKFVVKRNNQDMCIATHKLRFLDINNFLAPGFSYSKYLKAFGLEEEKGYFGYEYITGLDKLKETTLPPQPAFFSQLKNTNITEDEYAYCQRVCKKHTKNTHTKKHTCLL